MENKNKKKKFKINWQKVMVIIMLIATIALFVSTIVSQLAVAGTK